MPAIKISDTLYSVGVKHPDLEVFDLLMPLLHGTTYNSFLIKGEKNVVIDTVKIKFVDEFIENIRQVIDPSKIDYIVIQHNELDHAGSLLKLLELAPGAKVVISKAAENFLNNSFNLKLDIIKADDTTEIKLGPSQTLKFVAAPFLHWPDTMFTYYVEEKALFTCDAFGAHYCQKKGIYSGDMDRAEYGDDYFRQFKIYYEIIMRVYSTKVVAACEKIKNLPINLLLPSHGPLVNSDIARHIKYYVDWSFSAPSAECKKAVIVYSSMYGSTMKMAYHIESLLKLRGVKTFVAEIPFAMSESQMADVIKEIAASDAVLIGSSTICSTVLKPMWDFLFFLATVELKGKTGGVFGSFGWDPQGLKVIELVLSNYKMKLIKDMYKIKFVPSEDKLLPAEEFVDRLVKSMNGEE
jgi:flavorubredoxin